MSSELGLQSYYARVSQVGLLTHEREVELARKVIRLNDIDARSLMVMSNVRLVFRIAKMYARFGVPIDDLISEGTIGLLRAVEGFNPELNRRFATYATFWIKQSIHTAISDRLIHIPKYMGHCIPQWKRGFAELSKELGREPTMEELAWHLKMPLKTVRLIHRAMNTSASMENAMHEESSGMQETVQDQNDGPPEIALRRELLEALSVLLKHISPREAEVIRMHFGLDSGEGLTLQEIGDQLNLSRERVRQIKDEALRKLHNWLTTKSATRPHFNGKETLTRLSA